MITNKDPTNYQTETSQIFKSILMQLHSFASFSCSTLYMSEVLSWIVTDHQRQTHADLGHYTGCPALPGLLSQSSGQSVVG